MAHHTSKTVGWGLGGPLLSLIALTALAQDEPRGFDAHGFSLVAHDADIRDGLVLQRPGQMRGGSFFAGGVLEYAKAPLVLMDPVTGARDIVLDHVFAANVSLGGALHERLRLDALVPLFFTSTGPGGSQGVGLGDIRLSALGMALMPSDTGGWGLGLVPWLDLPSGVEEDFLGQRAVAGGALLAGTKEWDRLTFTANLGGRFSPRTERRNLQNADAVVAGLGGAFNLAPDTGIGLEVRGDLPVAKADVPGTGSPWEALASVRHVREGGAFLTGGAAMALSAGAGAATFRIFLGGGFGANIDDLGPRDRDLDGFVNREDDCPDEPETVNDYLDQDGCPDALPQLTVTVRQGDAVAQAADLEIDAEGGLVFDAPVSEPTTIGVRPGPAKVRASHGPCLAGEASADVASDVTIDVPLLPVRDALLQIGVRDPAGNVVADAVVTLTPADDACLADPVVLEAGNSSGYVGPTTWNIAVGAPGYHPFETGVMMVSGGDESVVAVLTPKIVLERVRIEETGIVLLEQVFFDTGRASLRPSAGPILDEVVAALQSLPRRRNGRVEVQGHTDNVGSEELNRKLSQARAETVLEYLASHGIPADRLVAKGYGEAKPTTTNRTADGRQANRRVEFVFVEAE